MQSVYEWSLQSYMDLKSKMATTEKKKLIIGPYGNKFVKIFFSETNLIAIQGNLAGMSP